MTKLRCFRIAATAILLSGWCAARGPRTVVSFNGDWRFHRGDEASASAPEFRDESWDRVTLPHTWNARDAVPGKDFYQGPGWYRKEFTPDAAWKQNRVFIRFEAASLVAEVFLNGGKLGEHKGGFSAFSFELTPHLRFGAKNLLALRLDNRRRPDVSPLGGDFTIFGGIYRPVSLIVTGAVAFTPLDYASPGVYLKQIAVSDNSAEVEVTAKVTNGSKLPRKVSALVTVFDARKRKVASARGSRSVPADETGALAEKVTIPKPHLWNGVSDPYLYTARIDLLEGGKVIDSLEQPLGLRYFHIDPARGFVLNGKPLQIRGVCRHQDWEGPGWAISEKEQDTDMALMREMGVNGVRLVHYQHNDYFHGLCDRNGLLTWAEMSQVDRVRGTPEYRENVRQQLRELIRQNFNHPSIVMWSLYNEIGSSNRGPDAPAPIVLDLNDLAHAEDPTRPTTGAASNDTIQNLPDVVRATDLVSLNTYPGWYSGKPEDMAGLIDKWNAFYGSKGMSLSEYGAGAGIHQHQQNMTAHPAPTGRLHPEEWQAIAHEGNYAAIRERPSVWGSFLWVMFDFASVGRHEGEIDGINDKGLVTRDRKVRKDAFYFYQANWTNEPMAYITSRRDAERAAPATDVKVYSNCPKVALKVNGKSYASVPGSGLHVFVWKEVALSEGDNRVEVEAESGGRTVRDSCNWQYRAK
jgi:beta-galactosidase